MSVGISPFSYSVFGLHVSSDLELLTLEPSSVFAGGIAVRAATVSWPDPSPDHNVILLPGLVPELVWNFDGWMRLGITRDRVHYQRLSGISENEVRHLLTDSALGLVLLLRGTPPLHAAAVRCGEEGGAAALCGQAGAGKSTLSLSLARAGYLKLADDVTAITLGEYGARVEPGIAHSKLLVDALDRLSLSPDSLRPVAHKLGKYIVPLDRWAQPEPLRYVIEIVRQPTGPVLLQEVSGVEKIGVLDRHTIGTTVMRRIGLRPMHMDWLSKLGACTRVFRLTRPDDRETVAELVALLRELWSQDARTPLSTPV